MESLTRVPALSQGASPGIEPSVGLSSKEMACRFMVCMIDFFQSCVLPL